MGVRGHRDELRARRPSAGYPILLAGTEAQKRRYLPRLAAGEITRRLLALRARRGLGRRVPSGPRPCGRGPLRPQRLQDVVLQRLARGRHHACSPPWTPASGPRGVTAFLVEPGLAGLRRRQAGAQDGHPRLARRWRSTSATARCPWRTASARRARASRSRCGPSTVTRPTIGATGGRHRPGGARRRRGLREGAPAVRPAHRARSRASSSCSPTWRWQVHASRLVVHHVASLIDRGRRGHRARGLDGQVLGRGRRDEGRDRRGADLRRLRLHAGVPGGALHARRQDHADLRGHQPDPADGHRPASSWASSGSGESEEDSTMGRGARASAGGRSWRGRRGRGGRRHARVPGGRCAPRRRPSSRRASIRSRGRSPSPGRPAGSARRWPPTPSTRRAGIKSLGGAKLELLLGDTQTKPDVGAAPRPSGVINQGAQMLHGLVRLRAAPRRWCPVAQQRRVPFLVDIAAADPITANVAKSVKEGQQKVQYVYRNFPTGSSFGQQGGAVLRRDLQGGRGLAEARRADVLQRPLRPEPGAGLPGRPRGGQARRGRSSRSSRGRSRPPDLSTEVSRAKAAKPDIIAPITRPASAQLLLPGDPQAARRDHGHRRPGQPGPLRGGAARRAQGGPRVRDGQRAVAELQEPARPGRWPRSTEALGRQDVRHELRATPTTA